MYVCTYAQLFTLSGCAFITHTHTHYMQIICKNVLYMLWCKYIYALLRYLYNYRHISAVVLLLFTPHTQSHARTMTHIHTQKTHTCMHVDTHTHTHTHTRTHALTWLPASVFSTSRSVCRVITRPRPPRWLSAGMPSSPVPHLPSQIYSALWTKVQS